MTALQAPVQPAAYTIEPTADTTSDSSAAADIVAGGQPNVGLFSWTTNDLTGVKDIVTYVKAALAAAESAQASAAQAESTKNNVEELSHQYEAIVNQIDNQYTQIVNLANTINVDVNQISAYVNEAEDIKDVVNQQYIEVNTWREEVIKYAMQAVYKYYERSANGQTVTLEMTNGSIQKLILLSSNTTVELNTPAGEENLCRQLTLMLQQGTGSNKVTWPSYIKWNNGRTPTLSYDINKIDIVTLLTKDSGASWFGFYNGGWFDA